VHQLLRLISLIILPITYLLAKICKANPSLVDWLYSGKLYPKVTLLIASLTKKLPFSVAEYALYALLGFAVLCLVIRLIALITFRKNALMKLVSLVITYVITCAYLVFFFYLLWGFNFYRTPIDERLALPNRDYSTQELYSLCVKLADDAAKLRTGLDEDTDGVFVFPAEEAFKAVADTYRAYGAEHELFAAEPANAKEVMWSTQLSKLNIAGVYVCYTAEPNVNCEQPALYLPFSAAHETAHYYGWAKEDQANFIAYMVCRGSDNKAVAYSASMHALSNCSSELYKRDNGMYTDLRTHYTEAMLRDLASYSRYYEQYKDTKASEVNDKINDSYLKLNGQTSGIIAYSEDVSLLLRYYDARFFFEKD